MLALSPFALRLLKASFNAAEDGLAGLQQLAHDANLLLLRLRGGPRGPHRLRREAPARLLALPAPPVRIWLMAARPRTLPAAIAPVLVGTSLAIRYGPFHPLAFVAALLGAVLIQIGTNLSNDYSDARRGADTDERHRPGARDRRRPAAAAPGARRDLSHLRRRRALRRLPDRRRRLGCCSRSARRRSSPACSTPAGRGRTATRASARCSCSCSSASSPSPAPTSCSARGLPWEAFVLAVPVGLLIAAILVVNNVARHRHRPPRRQAHARGAARARAHARAVRRDDRGGVRDLVGPVVRRRAVARGCS